MKKQILSFTLCMCLVLTLLPTLALGADDNVDDTAFRILNGETELTADESKTYKLTEPGTYTASGSTTNFKIELSCDSTEEIILELDNVTIDLTQGGAAGSPIRCTGDGNYRIIFKGHNVLKASAPKDEMENGDETDGYDGIAKGEHATLMIEGASTVEGADSLEGYGGKGRDSDSDTGGAGGNGITATMINAPYANITGFGGIGGTSGTDKAGGKGGNGIHIPTGTSIFNEDTSRLTDLDKINGKLLRTESSKDYTTYYIDNPDIIVSFYKSVDASIKIINTTAKCPCTANIITGTGGVGGDGDGGGGAGGVGIWVATQVFEDSGNPPPPGTYQGLVHAITIRCTGGTGGIGAPASSTSPSGQSNQGATGQAFKADIQLEDYQIARIYIDPVGTLPAISYPYFPNTTCSTSDVSLNALNGPKFSLKTEYLLDPNSCLKVKVPSGCTVGDALAKAKVQWIDTESGRSPLNERITAQLSPREGSITDSLPTSSSSFKLLATASFRLKVNENEETGSAVQVNAGDAPSLDSGEQLLDFSFPVELDVTLTHSSNSSGDSATSYMLTFDTNGGSSISSTHPSEYTTVDLTKYTPTREGYTFTGWYSDKDLTTKITSIRLTSNTTVYAGWERTHVNPDTGAWANPFTDVSESDWFYEDVALCHLLDLMKGTSDTTFSPYATMTRGMIATILWRLEGEPETTGTCPFSDVTEASYYEKSIAWAAENKIVSGYGNGKFGPDDAITREQLATILYNYAKFKEYDVSIGENTNILSYDDVSQISEYAIPSMQWACGAGIIGGDHNNLMPKNGANRAQAAAMLIRFLNVVQK